LDLEAKFNGFLSRLEQRIGRNFILELLILCKRPLMVIYSSSSSSNIADDGFAALLLKKIKLFH